MFSFNPNYGLPDDLRHRAVKRAKETNPVLAAAEYNLGVSTLYKWIKDHDEMSKSCSATKANPQ
jgi:hypothetical protein